MLIPPFRPEDTPDVVALWRACGLTRPWNDPHKDIARKMTVQPERFLVGVLDDVRGQLFHCCSRVQAAGGVNGVNVSSEPSENRIFNEFEDNENSSAAVLSPNTARPTNKAD